MTDKIEEIRKALERATPGRRVQFHPKCCPEAEGVHYTKWDSSHDTSVILPNGTRLQNYAHHKHAADAALDALAPDMARIVLAAGELKRALEFIRSNYDVADVVDPALDSFNTAVEAVE